MEISETKENKTNFDIFKTEYDDFCHSKKSENTDNPMEDCICLKRLFIALKYYSLLNIIDNEIHREVFINFVKEVYNNNLINDYIHLITDHQHQIELIYKTFPQKCDIKQCQFTSRHHKTSSSDNNSKLSDPLLNFYKETMDSLHFYCYHLFDVGLRILSQDSKQSDKEEDQELNEELNDNYDSQFARINTNINNRIHLSQSFNRFKGKDKFTIAAATKPGIYLFASKTYEHRSSFIYLIILFQMKQEQRLLMN